MLQKVLYETCARATGGRPRHDAGREPRCEADDTEGTWRPGRRWQQSGAALRRRLCRLLPQCDEIHRAEEPQLFPVRRERYRDLGIGPNAEGGFGLGIALSVSLPGLSDADAKNLMEQAHRVCPYSNATRNNADVRLGLG